MKPGYKIDDFAKMFSSDSLPLVVYVANYHNSNEIALYGYRSNSLIAESSENTVAKFTIKPKPCQTQS